MADVLTAFLREQAHKIADQVVAAVEKHRRREKLGKILFEILEKRDFSCVLAPIPEPLAGEAIAWRKKHVDEADILEPEDEAHVTVRYGLHTTNPADVARLLADAGPITIRLGETSIFSSDEYDVLKLDVESADLARLHEMLGALEHTDTHVDYRPHLTLAYLKPGTGQKYVGDQAFVGAKATIRDVIFSPPAEDAEKSRIALAAPLGPAQWFEDAIRNWPDPKPEETSDESKSLLHLGKHDHRPVERITFQGFPISIENPAGTYREWGHHRDKEEGVKSGRTLMLFPYGYIRLSEGADGDHVDAYIGPNENAKDVYVVRQLDPETGNYDEDKCVHSRTLVETSIGWRRINEIVRRKLRAKVRSVDPDTGRGCWRDIIGWQKRKTDEWIIIRHSGAQSSKGNRAITTLRCTPDHRVLTTSGLKEAALLSERDEIYVLARALTPTQESVLFGSLLGDGHLAKDPSANEFFCENHAYKESRYIRWKAAVLDASVRPRNGKYKGQPYRYLHLQTPRSPIWRQYRHVIYENGQRIIGRAWLDKLGSLGLAVWLMDDGSIINYPNHSLLVNLIATCSPNDRTVIEAFFAETHGVRSVPTLYGREHRRRDDKGRWAPGDEHGDKCLSWTLIKQAKDGRRTYRLAFNLAASTYLLELLKDFMVPDDVEGTKKKWKAGPIIDRGPLIAVPTKIKSIRRESAAGQRGKRSDSYDLTVEGTHLFVPNGVVTSNCFLGFDSEHAARLAFLAHRDDGDKAFGGITTYPVEEFREKVRATMKHPGAVKLLKDFNPDQPRDAHGRFAPGGGGEHEGDESLSPARLSEMSPDKAERERARLREVHGRQREARRASAKERDRLNASRADQKDWAVRNTPAELKDKRTEMFGDRPIALKGDVSNLMASSVRVAYDNTIPQSVKDSLATARVTVTVARDSVAQALPRLADAQPRGWTEGATFKQVDGVFSPTDFTAVVSEMHQNAAGQPELSNRTAGVLRHEVGHAFDFSNAVKPGTGEGWASDQPTMIDAYEKDVVKQVSDYVSRIPEGLPPEEHARLATRDFYSKNSDLAYFLQSGSAGRQEAFAEVFAQMHGTGSTRADVAAAFPNYRSEIEHYVKTGKVRASWE